MCTFGATCNNGIKDGDESDVDCGGIDSGCLPCCWSERAASSAAACTYCPPVLCVPAARLSPCRSLSPPHPAAAGKTCQINSDCLSGACEAGRCAEAKYCASRFLYDNLGVNIQLRTFDDKEALLGDQKAIKCGQCVCQDCPVRTAPSKLPHETAGPAARSPAYSKPNIGG